MAIVNENSVLEFYLAEMDKDSISFLKNKTAFKKDIRKYIENLRDAENMNEKIEVSKKLWKVLFEAAMSYIDPDKRGYDELFKYFDEYVEFEELIFASDSFYRDHTVHCLWVYFLGEYITKKDEYKFLFKNALNEAQLLKGVKCFVDKLGKNNENLKYVLGELIKTTEFEDSIKCVAAITHDLGYPLKKINKINKSIGKILPYFSVQDYNEFSFQFNNIQKSNIDSFIDFLSNDFEYSISTKDDNNKDELSMLFDKIFVIENGYIFGLKERWEEILQETEIKKLEDALKSNIMLKFNRANYIRYCSDFEEYEHGIMSAFLLMRVVKTFTNSKFSYGNNSDIKAHDLDYCEIYSKQDILRAISDHTSSSYNITGIEGVSSILTFIDELEEFSRISRANQSRQYVSEFCKTDIYVENEVFNIDFIFDNEKLDNLDPERAFKGRCKRFLTLFNIPKLSDNLKLRLRCIGKLSYDNNVYSLEIRKKYAKISINDEEKNIPQYLKGRQFYSREEYEEL